MRSSWSTPPLLCEPLLELLAFKATHLGEACRDGHAVLQELHGAVLLPHVGKLALVGALGLDFRVSVARVQAIEDVQGPLFRFPPRP